VTRSSLWRLAVLIPLFAACTDAQRRAAEEAKVRKETATQVRRLCDLPPAQRAAELERIQNESDVVVLCGNEE
jgi:hypothetical protein